MVVRLADVVVFVYNLGVLLTGAYLGDWALDVSPTLLAGVVVAAAVWAAYFRWQIAPRLETLAERDVLDAVAGDGSS